MFAVFACTCRFQWLKLAKARFNSRLDYCNVLIQTIARKDIAELQRLHNYLARLVFQSRRFSRSVVILNRSFGSPCDYIQSPAKLFHSTTFIDASDAHANKMTNTAPIFKQNFARVKTETGSRTFSGTAPTLWNSLLATLNNLEMLLHFATT